MNSDMNSDGKSDRTRGNTQVADVNSAGQLDVQGIAMAFGSHQVLRHVDLGFAPGSITAVLGPSGCGKTTLLRLLAGFVRPDDGSITLAGRVLADGGTFVPPERRSIGIVAQEGALFPNLTVADNVGFGLRRVPDRDARIREWLDRVGLLGHAGSRPRELSGGQQQRVALARALAARPQVVLLDEPFSSLDTHLREQVRAEVVDVITATGVTAVLVTHDREEALSTADRVAVMFNGAIAQVGTPPELYDRPETVDVASFVGELCIVAGALSGEGVDTALGRLPVHRKRAELTCDRTVLAVRPEQLQVGPGADATVARTRYLGSRVRLDLKLSDGTEVFTYVPGTSPWRAGDTVGIRVLGQLLELGTTASLMSTSPIRTSATPTSATPTSATSTSGTSTSGTSTSGTSTPTTNARSPHEGS